MVFRFLRDVEGTNVEVFLDLFDCENNECGVVQKEETEASRD